MNTNLAAKPNFLMQSFMLSISIYEKLGRINSDFLGNNKKANNKMG